MVCSTSQPCYPKDFYQLIINFLCSIKNSLQPTVSGVRYDWEILCDPTAGDPVALRFSYTTNGTLAATTAYNLDGTTYSSPITDLVACGTDSTGIVRYDYNVLCDPDTGFPVLLRFAYHIDGEVTGVTAFDPDGTTYGGSLANLIACTGGEGGIFNGYSFQTLCDPSTGAPILLRVHYSPDGSISDTEAFTTSGDVYSGSVESLMACSAAAAEEGVFYPTPDTSSIIGNPGVGLQSVSKTEAATDTGGFNPNNYPLRNANYRYPWKLAEPSEGVYNFTDAITFLNKAGQYNQIVNFRIYEFDPGSGYDVPDYAYTYAGWEVTYPAVGPTVFRLCYWGDPDVLNGFSNMLQALYAAIGTHPALGSIDVGWGAYNENTYSGTSFTGTDSGTVPAVVIGNELPHLTLAEAQGFYDVYQAAIPNIDVLKVSMIASVPSFNYGVGHHRMGQRLDGWGYRNNPGGCPGGGSNMCTEVPATIISPGTYPLGWVFGERIAETYGTIYSGGTNWVSNNWDYAASFLFAWQTAHISEYNVKQQLNPPTSPNVKGPFETMLKNSGFRYTLTSIGHDRDVTAGNNIAIRTAWTNTGNAPNYHQQKLAYLLRNPVTEQEYIFITPDLAQWQPGTAPVYNHSFQVPPWFDNGPARIYVGIVDTAGIPKIQLANSGDTLDRWWYDGGEVDVDNSTPTTAPATAYALESLFASSEGLQSINVLHDLSNYDNTNYYSFHAFVKFISFPSARSVNMTIMGREGFGSAGSNQFWVGYRAATDRLAFSIDTGANSFTVDADELGQPQIDTWYKVYTYIDNVTKTIGIKIGDGVVDGLSYTGSPRTDLNLRFSVGGGGFPYYFDGQIAEARVFNKLLSTSDLTYAYNNNLPLPYSRLTNAFKYGLRYSWEMTETSGARIDAQQLKGLNAVGTPTRVQIA